jgi:NADPH:quinone reductase-like Zn-dependent oxidoreductase
MPWQHIRIARFGGPEVLELAEEQTVPAPGPGEVRIKVLAAGTGFTDTFIRRGRYPDFKGPLPFTPGYDLVGVVETTAPGVTAPREGQLVADLYRWRLRTISDPPCALPRSGPEWGRSRRSGLHPASSPSD